MLHGYDNGHRFLGGSVSLKNRADMDTIATLSDWSEYVAEGGSEPSYITAYPLKESGYYVIAKTWYADEMKRPGCVWTHSLLLPFDLLNDIDDFKRMLELFVRPSEKNGFDVYSHQIDYKNRHYMADDYRPLNVDRDMATRVLVFFLTAKNRNMIFGGISNNRPYEELMLGGMTSLTKEMIQNVSWTTGTGYVRKLNSKPLTCQIVSGSSDSSHVGIIRDVEPWISYIVDGLMRGDVNQGQIIRMFADDIGDSVEHYSAIVRVLYTLEDYLKTNKSAAERYKDVLEIIGKAFPTKYEGNTIKWICVSKNFSDRYCNDKTFFYDLGTLPLDSVFEEEDFTIQQRWENYIEKNHEEYVILLSDFCNSGNINAWGMRVLRESAEKLTEQDVIDIVKKDYHLFYTITYLAPKILNTVSWEMLAPVDVEKLLPLILNERTQFGFMQWNALFVTLLEKNVNINIQLADTIFNHTEKATKIVFDFVNEDELRSIKHILYGQLYSRTYEVLKWLAGVDSITNNVAYDIVNVVNEDASVVVSSGSEVWKPFLSLNNQCLRTEVYAYLFALSFNWPAEPTAIELMRMSFEPLHRLESSGGLTYSNWSRIAPYMASVKTWEEWDKCKKMRKTVVKRLKCAGFNKNTLINFTSDRDLNEQLIRMW